MYKTGDIVFSLCNQDCKDQHVRVGMRGKILSISDDKKMLCVLFESPGETWNVPRDNLTPKGLELPDGYKIGDSVICTKGRPAKNNPDNCVKKEMRGIVIGESNQNNKVDVAWEFDGNNPWAMLLTSISRTDPKTKPEQINSGSTNQESPRSVGPTEELNPRSGAIVNDGASVPSIPDHRRLAARPLSELSGGRLIERILREEERARRS